MAKKKRMTNREKKERAAMKKRLQEEGFLPPDKPRLNRKKFIEEAVSEWDGRDEKCLIWNIYLIRAVSYMLGHRNAGKISPEAVGAAKVLKIAVRLQRFETELKEKGQEQYSAGELYDHIKDIINA